MARIGTIASQSSAASGSATFYMGDDNIFCFTLDASGAETYDFTVTAYVSDNALDVGTSIIPATVTSTGQTSTLFESTYPVAYDRVVVGWLNLSGGTISGFWRSTKV